MTRRSRRWLVAGAAGVAAVALTATVAPDSPAAVLSVAALALWVVLSLLWLAARLWRRLTYRVGVRLLLSYLILGVTPFLFSAAFAGVGLYILAGQYLSVRSAQDLERPVAALVEQLRELTEVSTTGSQTEVFDAARDFGEHPPAPLTRALWWVRVGDAEHRDDALAELPDPAWLRELAELDGMVSWNGTVYRVRSAAVSAQTWLAVLVPLDPEQLAALAETGWYQASAHVADRVGSEESSIQATFGDQGGQIHVREGETGADEQIWSEWTGDQAALLDRPWIVWFRLLDGVRDLATGRVPDDNAGVVLLRTSPAAVWRDLVRSQYQLDDTLRGLLVGLGVFFLIVYGVALVIAGGMIVSVSRSASRLTRGARQVAEGALDVRIPVRRRDELGDLAATFNTMTASVQSMLSEVAEKERLARELELARQIQEHLLPEPSLSHGRMTVFAVFRPAQEVGGDCFDLVPGEGGTLVATIGDVAGHGLPTGLLMAALNSAATALLREGHGGGPLLERLNRLLVEQWPGRTMATFAVLELDPEGRTLRLASAGHPPPLYVGPKGQVEELGGGSLPLGLARHRPALTERELEPGSRVLLYSDGLVEGADPEGEPFGYERLREVLGQLGPLPPAELVAGVLARFDAHTAHGAPADDLTIIAVAVA